MFIVVHGLQSLMTTVLYESDFSKYRSEMSLSLPLGLIQVEMSLSLPLGLIQVEMSLSPPLGLIQVSCSAG